MSIDSTLNGIQSVTTTIQSGVNAVTRLAKDVGIGGVSGVGTYWKDSLQPASYRGVRFGVLSSAGQFGRRNVVHAYPYRDQVWVEDLGRGPRRVNMRGFLVENGAYGGGSVIAQRERMIAAAETPGEGELVHPTLGRMKVSLVGPLGVEERWDQGRVFEITFSFIESGKRIFPTVSTSTANAVAAACTAADAAASSDFGASVGSTLAQGAAVVLQAASTAAAWARKAQKLTNDATNLYNMVGTLKGSFGRFSGGRSSGISGAANTIASKANSISGLIAAGSAARTGVSSAISKLNSAASGLGS
jgi:prophage DNA circulation protein